MQRFFSITLIVMVLILSLPVAVSAAEPGNGMIEGKLTNATAGGGSVGDQEVTLKTYRNDAELTSATARTDGDGRFIFQGLDTSPGYSYQVTLIYQQAEYTGDRISFDTGETSKSTEIIVYDSTTSGEAIKVTTAHTIIYAEQGNLRIIEYLTVVNDSDQTYIGPRELSPGVRETLSFAMPTQATGLQVGASLMDCCIYTSDGGFVDSMAVLPGTKELAYTYDIGYKGEEYVFSRKVNYPTVSYDLLVQSPDVQITGARLAQAGPTTIEGTQFNHFYGENLAQGDVVAAQISGLSKSNKQAGLMWVLLALLVLGSGFTFFYLKNRRRQQPVRVSQARQEESLLAEVARLDDDYEAGRISEKVYHRLRAQKKAQLVQLLQGAKRGRDRK